jgi:hypothetical protein
MNKKYKCRIKNNIQKIKELEMKLEIYKQLDNISKDESAYESSSESEDE